MTKSHIPSPKRTTIRAARTTRKAGFARLRLGIGMWVLGFGIVVTSVSGCTKARAQTVPDSPPLAVPPPPERVITATEEPEVAVAAPPAETPTAAAAPLPPPRPASPRPQPATPAASQPVPPPVSPTEPPRVTRPTAADVAEERKIRDILQRATRDINRVDTRRLTPDGRSQYDQSKSLAEQAEEAVKDRNWVFAQTLADKAATLAAELLAR